MKYRISIKDFVHNFLNVHLCHLSPDSFKSDIRKIAMNSSFQNRFGALELEKQRWNSQVFHAYWTRNVSAGGNPENQTFAMNPQFTVDLTLPDEGENTCTLIVALMQREDRQMHNEAKHKYFEIGYIIYQVLINDFHYHLKK